MNILGIETSCDETAAAVVQNGKTILSNVVASSLNQHKEYGGIIPEIASRRQIEFINFVVKQALKLAQVSLKNIHAIAVTESPGLIGSLLVGISFARALSYATGKPLINVDHIKAHLYANFLTFSHKISGTHSRGAAQGILKPHPGSESPRLPAIGLVVSGGHSSLFYVKDFRHCQLLGQTRDDAAGEAFDKVARILNLGYPGGPIIDRLAKTGQNKEIHFTCAQIPDSNDFSFSGIKTAVLYFARDKWDKNRIPVNKIAYAFQNSVVSALVNKCLEVCRQKHISTLLVGGGVAANSELRKRLLEETPKHRITTHIPALPLCMDNAAMIAGLGYHMMAY